MRTFKKRLWQPLAMMASTLVLMDGGVYAQKPELITDPDAYAVYKVVLPASDGRLLLQAETEYLDCGDLPVAQEWREAFDSYRRANGRVQIIRFNPPVDRYRIRPRAELREAYKPTELSVGSNPYATASAVGFNKEKTRAVVFVSMGYSGTVSTLEKRGSVWVSVGDVCGFVA